AFSFIISSYYNDLYDLRVISNFDEFGARLPQTFGIAFLLTAALYTLFPHLGLRYESFPAGLWGLLVIVGWVTPLRLLLCLILKSRPFAEQVLIVGTNSLASTVAEELTARSPISSTIVGLVSDKTDGEKNWVTAQSPTPYPILGSVDQLIPLVDKTHPDRIIV